MIGADGWQLQVLDTRVVANPDPNPEPDTPPHALEFHKLAEATVSYPVTRILWEPESKQKASCDLLATSGDHLRLWSIPEAKSRVGNTITRSTTGASGSDGPPTARMTPLALLSNSKSPEHTAPLTSLDWNTISPSLIITSSIDTTCTIWDIPSLTAKTQLIAHDREVFDVRFCANSVDVFVSCGADGSVRMFDLRSLEHSTIIYEPSDKNDKCESELLVTAFERMDTNDPCSVEPRRHEPHEAAPGPLQRPRPPPPRQYVPLTAPFLSTSEYILLPRAR